MPVAEEFVHTRNIREVAGTWINVTRVDTVTAKGKDYSTMVLHTDQGRFYATPYIKKQLEAASDPTGYYDVVPFSGVLGDGIALRNLPPQVHRAVPRAQPYRGAPAVSPISDATFKPASQFHAATEQTVSGITYTGTQPYH